MCKQTLTLFVNAHALTRVVLRSYRRAKIALTTGNVKRSQQNPKKRDKRHEVIIENSF